MPKVCMDYKEFRKGRPPVIVVRDKVTGLTACHRCVCKGPTDKWICKRVERDIDNTGHTAITLKGDGENAL